MEIISRQEAKDRGLDRYFLGQECCNGHISEYSVATGRCLECRKESSARYLKFHPDRCKISAKKYLKTHSQQRKEYRKEYKKSHKEKIKRQGKEYRQKNKEKIKLADKLYRLTHSQQIKEAGRRYSIKNRVKIEERNKQYRLNNPDRVKKWQKTSARSPAHKTAGIKYRKNNRVKCSQRAMDYYNKNKEKCRTRARKYREEHIDQHNKILDQWRKDNPDKCKAHGAHRRAKKLNATAKWAAREDIEAIYKEARRLTRVTGVQHDVDHIVPLQGELVTGLHVEYNLQILDRIQNLKKKNRFDPLNPTKWEVGIYRVQVGKKYYRNQYERAFRGEIA